MLCSLSEAPADMLLRDAEKMLRPAGTKRWGVARIFFWLFAAFP
jgi:hypothetical protein